MGLKEPMFQNPVNFPVKCAKGKTTKMKDDQNGRRPKWKTTIIEDNQSCKGIAYS